MGNQYEKNIEKHIHQYTKYIDRKLIEKVIDINKVKHIKKGQMIDMEDKPFFIVSGIIRGFYLDIDGNDITHTFLTEGSILGAEFLTTDKPELCVFETITECTMIKVDIGYFKNELTSNSGLLMVYISMLENSLKLKVMRDISLVTKTATARYLEFIKQYPQIEKDVP